jgi:type II secretory ATPase GspE/PulE/Tfp pilus assembly ATPase PilB-like protein
VQAASPPPRRIKEKERVAAGAGLLDASGNPVVPPDSRTDSIEALALASDLLRRAVERGASRVIVRPDSEGEYNAVFRTDGVEETASHLETMQGGALITAFKRAAGMNPGDRRGGQKGTVQISGTRGVKRCIVQTAASGGGEQVVIRLKTLSAVPPLEGLGIPERELAGLRELLSGGQGLVLLLGRSGAGTTTTYYAILDAPELIGRGIVSIESLPEYRTANAVQLEIDPASGKTLLKLLNQSINDGADTLAIALLNEGESARLAFNAARNGKLVIAALDCATPLEAFSRLERWEITPRMLGGMPLCMLSQALARRSDGGMAGVFAMPERSQLESLLSTRGVTIDMVRGAAGGAVDGSGLEEELESLVNDGSVTRDEAARVMRTVMRKGE